MSETAETGSLSVAQQQCTTTDPQAQEYILPDAAETISQDTPLTQDASVDLGTYPDADIIIGEDGSITQDPNEEKDTATDVTTDITLGRNTLMLSRNGGDSAPLYIGGAVNPRRDMVGWSAMEDSGWVSRFMMTVSRTDPGGFPQVIRVNVGEAFNPHRCMVSLGGVTGNGWTPRLIFFAWPTFQTGLVLVSVAHAPNPWRCKFELGRHIDNRPEDQGWIERFVFWVPRGSVRVIRG